MIYWESTALAKECQTAFLAWGSLIGARLKLTTVGFVANLVRYHGARHATGYGLVNADYQVDMAALTFLRRFSACLAPSPPNVGLEVGLRGSGSCRRTATCYCQRPIL